MAASTPTAAAIDSSRAGHCRAAAPPRFPTACSPSTPDWPACSPSIVPTASPSRTSFTPRNVRSALKLGHARGVALLAASEAGVPIVEYTPTEVKRAVVGFGRAEKHQVAADGQAAARSRRRAVAARRGGRAGGGDLPHPQRRRRRRSRRAATALRSWSTSSVTCSRRPDAAATAWPDAVGSRPVMMES